MNGIRLAAIAIILAGLLALAYGGFSYTRETTAVKLGPLELKVNEKKAVNVPVWAGVAAVLIGGVLLLSSGRKS